MNLKRLWDTENKKTVRAIPTWDPHKKFQVWTDDDGSHLYVYANSKYEELNTANAAVSEYWPTVWKTLDDETVGYYLTNEPTDLYNWDEGDDVTYTFKDYDWTVLKTGKLEEGETPTPPADPTRAATAQYTYTFAGWNPTVWPISKKTTYTATYTATVNKYTITATSSDADLWTVSPASVANVEYGTALTVEDNVITVGTWESAPTITATAGEGWEFVSWWDVPATVTGNTSVEATFQEEVNLCTVTLNVKNWVEEDGAIVAADDQNPLRATRTPVSVQVPAGCIVAGDQSLTDEEMDAWMSSLDFMLPDSQDGDEPAASFKFTPAESLPEWSYVSAQYNFDEIIDVEWAAADENNNVIITWDATLPIYLMKGDE